MFAHRTSDLPLWVNPTRADLDSRADDVIIKPASVRSMNHCGHMKTRAWRVGTAQVVREGAWLSRIGPAHPHSCGRSVGHVEVLFKSKELVNFSFFSKVRPLGIIILYFLHTVCKIYEVTIQYCLIEEVYFMNFKLSFSFKTNTNIPCQLVSGILF